MVTLTVKHGKSQKEVEHPAGEYPNANIEPDLLRPWLIARGYDADVVTKAIAELQRAARMEGLKLYEVNRATYDMLRYGVQVTPGPGEAPVPLTLRMSRG